PVNLDHLTRLLRVNAHHESAVFCKRNTMVAFEPNPVFDRPTMKALAFDYIHTGMGYVRWIKNRAGFIVRAEHLHSRVMRRHKNLEQYLQLTPDGRTILFEKGEVAAISNYGPESSVYGLPDYLGALNSLLLNEEATLFRRKYYVNGAHMGFILYTDAEDLDQADINTLKAKVAASKGIGNFQSLFVNLRQKDAKLELKPVGDFAKDDFEKIKMVSRDDIISAHRVPPQILAVLTDNKYPVTGDLDKIVAMYNATVVKPLQEDVADAINKFLPPGQQIVFKPFTVPTTAAPPEG
ncbi:MAG TPA: phage portal protein, partial [bacterium]